ncbi:MAG: SH3 domain-containing protein [Desulfovibrionaceae bacterium]|nr:SH3 domain-containing protein [Desulfovibrionaceae bacterium]
MNSRTLWLILSLLLVFNLTGCGSKKPAPAPSKPKTISIADEKNFPQDLNFYARHIGPKRRLLTPEQQSAAKHRFDRIYFGPWQMSHTTVNPKNICVRKARGYKENGQRWTQAEWDQMVANANISNFPSLALPAITVRNTDLRENPTHKPRYDKTGINPYKYPFDDFQYSQLPIGMPLFISHQSADGRWFFVECPLVGGWIDSNDVAFVDDSFKSKWLSYPLAAIVKDQVPLPQIGTPATIGTVLPLVKTRGSSVTLLVPQKNAQHQAIIQEINLTTEEAQPHPLVLTPASMAKLGNMLISQPYGWGGMYGLRDCSATTHDLLAPFGIWLPRNSRAQARTGVVVSLEGLTPEAKEDLIKKSGTPFLSLVGLPGHITMYVGTYEGKVAILHNAWGVRTIEGSNTNARHIIGKTVVTSIKPGIELPNLYRTRTFVDNIRALATPVH